MRWMTWKAVSARRYLMETSDVSKYARPAKPLKIYEFEGCPFCKKVRATFFGVTPRRHNSVY